MVRGWQAFRARIEGLYALLVNIPLRIATHSLRALRRSIHPKMRYDEPPMRSIVTRRRAVCIVPRCGATIYSMPNIAQLTINEGSKARSRVAALVVI
jgi:hypothetical protein